MYGSMEETPVLVVSMFDFGSESPWSKACPSLSLYLINQERSKVVERIASTFPTCSEQGF